MIITCGFFWRIHVDIAQAKLKDIWPSANEMMAVLDIADRRVLAQSNAKRPLVHSMSAVGLVGATGTDATAEKIAMLD